MTTTLFVARRWSLRGAKGVGTPPFGTHPASFGYQRAVCPVGEVYQGPFLPRPNPHTNNFISVFGKPGFKLGSDRTPPFAL